MGTFGAVTKYQYDPSTGYLTNIINDYGQGRLNSTTGFNYDSVGNIILVTDAQSHTFSFDYDILNQLTKIISPAPFNYQTRYSYDKNGNVTKIERQADESGSTWQTTEYDYDIFDHVVKSTVHGPQSIEIITQYEYDGNGNRTKVIDSENHATTYIYDERDLLYKVTDALNNVTEYSYDGNANPTRIKDAKGNTTNYEYDDFDRVTKTTYSDSSYEQYTYDKNSNLLTKRTRKGDVISYTYDLLNRLIQKTYPDNSAITYDYDITSRLIEVADSVQRIAYSYDSLNRVTQTTTQGKSISYAYDQVGNRTMFVYPDASFLSYEYDELNRLDKIKDQTAGTIADYDYDVLSRRIGVNLANNTQTTYEYDNVNRLLNLANKINGGADISTFGYTYDKVGNRLTKDERRGTINIGMHNYGYDKIYQLTSVDYPDGSPYTDTAFDFDPLGNREIVTEGTNQETYTSNNLNQYTDIDGTSLTYDLNGNLLTDGRNSYEYDCENRLVKATTPTNIIRYKYDPFGRRIAKDIYDSGNVFISGEKYLYSGDEVLCEYDNNDTLLRKFILSDFIDEPILMEDVLGGEKYYYSRDGLGSVIEVIDSTGSVVENYKFDAYGGPLMKDESNTVLSESAINNSSFFTNRRYDQETGLYHYRARAYSPNLGRFLQTDPVEYEDSMNPYQYCLNSPNNFIDPFGLCAKGGNKGILPGGYMYPQKEKEPEMPNPLEEVWKKVKRGFDKLELAKKLSYYAEGKVEAEVKFNYNKGNEVVFETKVPISNIPDGYEKRSKKPSYKYDETFEGHFGNKEQHKYKVRVKINLYRLRRKKE